MKKSDNASNKTARILWLHDRIISGNYPNAAHIADRFGVSLRQGQRDVEYMKSEFGAPIEYDYVHRGFKYSKEFLLPTHITDANDEDFSGITAKFSGKSKQKNPVQLQIPYIAELEIPDKLAVLELKNLIIESHPRKHRYFCEFRSTELFLGMIMSMNTSIKIISPAWLRERAVSAAEKVLEANK
ncbi:MAG: hypothetical protein J6036_02070 [Clostridia bacterium]|nr:hypothetical protein [Clostridia bacterium]